MTKATEQTSNEEIGRLLQPATVLYVEDEAEILEQLAIFLRRRVGKLLTASNGREGLELFRQHHPDLVITDIRMPDMDGLALARAIRETAPETPIIVTSAHNDDEFFLQAIELDVDHYVIKPIDPYQLLKALSRSARTLWQRKEIDATNRYVRFLLDTHPNFLMVVSGTEIEYMNRTFLDFLGCSSLTECAAAAAIELHFLSPTDGETLLTASSSHDWAETLRHQITTNPIVYLRNPASPLEDHRPFAVTCNTFAEGDKYIFSFADVRQLVTKMSALERLAFTDELTGLSSRTRIRDFLEREFETAQRYGQPLSLIMFDIDHFKRVNDTFGHQAGDDVLRELSRLVEKNIRSADLFARWGGEEFMILSPGITCKQTTTFAEKVRGLIEAHTFPHVGQITCSFGVAQLRTGETPHDLIEHADMALYRAKEEGRNRVVSAATAALSSDALDS